MVNFGGVSGAFSGDLWGCSWFQMSIRGVLMGVSKALQGIIMRFKRLQRISEEFLVVLERSTGFRVSLREILDMFQRCFKKFQVVSGCFGGISEGFRGVSGTTKAFR